MREKEPTKTDLTEPWDVLASRKMRSIPRVRPRASFRARVTLYSYFPSLGVMAAERAGGGERTPGGGTRPLILRGAVYVAAAAVVLLALFGGLTLAAGGAVPGDPLYAFKKARENVELAFTGGGSAKAEKNLQLAETRVSELAVLVSKKQASPDKIESIAKNFETRTAAVEEALQNGTAGAEAGAIAARLSDVTTQKDNVVNRLAAVEPADLLAPAAGAKVRVTSGGNDRWYTTDATGSFDVDASEVAAAGAEAHVEADGRGQALPLGEGQTVPAQAGRVSAKFEHPLDSLVVGRPQTVTICFSDNDGAALDFKTVRLRDLTGTSIIDGNPGEAYLETDANGRVSFILTRTSVDRMTRLSATVDGEAGEVAMAPIGGLEFPAGSITSPVAARAFGPTDNLSSVELDNGIAKVTLDRNLPGRVVTAITRDGMSSMPLDDPLATVPGATSFARLAVSSGNSAVYELTIDSPVTGGAARKIWRVGLCEGEGFARVSCRFEKYSGSAAPAENVLDVLSVSCPGASLNVSGQPFDASNCAQPVMLSFNTMNPCAACQTGNSITAIAVPADSKSVPVAWLASSSALGVRVNGTAVMPGYTDALQLLVTVADTKGAEELGRKAMAGAGPMPLDTNYDSTGEGFLLKVSSAGGKTSISVYKRYESAF